MIRLNNYSFRYRGSSRFALEGISLDIRKGEVLCVVGASGAGKTTFGYGIAGLLAKHFPGSTQAGSIEFAPGADPADRSNIGFVFQDSSLQLSGITESVEEELAFSLEQFGLPQSIIRDRIEEQLSFFGMDRLRHRHPNSLSGGETQLLSIAAEAAKHPSMFILDEPAQALDMHNIDLLAEAIQEWKKSAAVVVAEEQVGLTHRVGDRFLFLADGTPRFLGPLEEMWNSQLDFASLEIPQWVTAQLMLKHSPVSNSLQQSVRWLKKYPISV